MTIISKETVVGSCLIMMNTFQRARQYYLMCSKLDSRIISCFAECLYVIYKSIVGAITVILITLHRAQHTYNNLRLKANFSFFTFQIPSNYWVHWICITFSHFSLGNMSVPLHFPNILNNSNYELHIYYNNFKLHTCKWKYNIVVRIYNNSR